MDVHTIGRYHIVPGKFFPWNARDWSSFCPSRAVVGTWCEVGGRGVKYMVPGVHDTLGSMSFCQFESA